MPKLESQLPPRLERAREAILEHALGYGLEPFETVFVVLDYLQVNQTAAYGGLTRGPRVIDDGVRERMKGILAEIESGDFAAEFLKRHTDTAGLAAAEAEGPLAEEGRRVLPRLHPEDTQKEEPS